MSAAKYLASKVDHEAEGLELRAERDEALKALAGSRARFADSEARRAELESVIAKAQQIALESDQGDSFGPITEALDSTPLAVLEDRDREVAARTLEAMADEGERFMFGATGERMPSDMDVEGIQPRWREIHRLRERAAAIRKGDTNA